MPRGLRVHRSKRCIMLAEAKPRQRRLLTALESATGGLSLYGIRGSVRTESDTIVRPSHRRTAMAFRLRPCEKKPIDSALPQTKLVQGASLVTTMVQRAHTFDGRCDTDRPAPEKKRAKTHHATPTPILFLLQHHNHHHLHTTHRQAARRRPPHLNNPALSCAFPPTLARTFSACTRMRSSSSTPSTPHRKTISLLRRRHRSRKRATHTMIRMQKTGKSGLSGEPVLIWSMNRNTPPTVGTSRALGYGCKGRQDAASRRRARSLVEWCGWREASSATSAVRGRRRAQPGP